MITDPHKERDLELLGVKASVESDRGACVIRMSCDQFDRLIEGVNKVADQPDWHDEVKDQLGEAEAALREVSFLLRSAERRAKEARRYVP